MPILPAFHGNGSSSTAMEVVSREHSTLMMEAAVSAAGTADRRPNKPGRGRRRREKPAPPSPKEDIVAQPTNSERHHRARVIDLWEWARAVKGRRVLKVIVLWLVLASGGVDAAIIEPYEGEEEATIRRTVTTSAKKRKTRKQ